MLRVDTELDAFLAWLSSWVDQLAAELKDPDTPEERRVVIRSELRGYFDALQKVRDELS